MNEVKEQNIHRILVIDDNPNIHKDFQTILVEENDSSALDELRAEVFGSSNDESNEKSIYELDFASQGLLGEYFAHHCFHRFSAKNRREDVPIRFISSIWYSQMIYQSSCQIFNARYYGFNILNYRD